ncbi:MAG: hypothetical protein FWF73_07230 [Spirochaetes bacterium]|nr:hypothetical protein [Spirochaetota bacterium]
MKKIITGIFILSFILSFLLSALYGKDSKDEFIIGKTEFSNKNGSEWIVTVNSTDKKYMLKTGALLAIKRGDKHIVLKINDSDGKYLKCAAVNKNSDAIKYGEDVYYLDSMNSNIKYKDAERILAELIKLYQDFILKIESNDDPLIISTAMKEFSSSLGSLIPEMKRINDKYPELKNFNIDPPDELKNESDMLEALEPRLKEAFFKIKILSEDKNIKKAMDDLHNTLLKMDNIN